MDYLAIAKEILKDVGGKDNIVDVTHCYTRLRFVLKDTKQANKEALLQTEGVISVVESGGQYQVVLGNKVAHVYNALEPLLAQQLTTKTSTKEKNSLGNRILNTVAAIFTPVVPAIAASWHVKRNFSYCCDGRKQFLPGRFKTFEYVYYFKRRFRCTFLFYASYFRLFSC